MIIWTHSTSSNQASFPIPKPHEGGLKLCLWTKLQPSKTFCVLMKTSSYGWDWILLVLSDLSWRFRQRIRGRFLSRSPVRVERWFLVNSVSICEYFEQLVCADLPSACRVWLYILNLQKEAVLFLLWDTFMIELVQPTKVILLWFISHTWPTESLSASWGRLTGEGRLCRYRLP